MVSALAGDGLPEEKVKVTPNLTLYTNTVIANTNHHPNRKNHRVPVLDGHQYSKLDIFEAS